MTALETLMPTLFDVTSIGTELWCTSTCLEDACNEEKITTIACAISTTLHHIEIPKDIAMVRDAQSYVQSMSDEELANFDQMLAEKGLEFENEEEINVKEETPKTYKKV